MFFEAKGINKSYGGRSVLQDISLGVRPAEIISLIGPSGVGKTTLLKIIAGLEQPDGGTLAYASPPSREHPVILVFQDYLLFPALTVFENVAFGLKVRKLKKREVRRRVLDMLSFFHMEEHARKHPAQLSAGQRQRVAIARAMVVQPAMLLLDEPFANLDRNLKLETAQFIRETQKSFGVTTISVTHDQEEAFVMSDRVGLMLDGRLVQYDTAEAIYENPVSLEAARFTGQMNRIGPQQLDGVQVDGAYDPSLPLHVRPEHLTLKISTKGCATVRGVTFAGHYARFSLQFGRASLVAFGRPNGIRPGDRVDLRVRQHMQNRSVEP